jgi:hypothetical protein
VIEIRTIITWSWKNEICSMIIEVLSWNEREVQVGII